MQGLMVVGLIVEEILNVDIKCVKSIGAQNIGQGHSYHIIIGFLINVQVQGQHPHQWAPFQIAGLLHAWQISHLISRYVYHEG